MPSSGMRIAIDIDSTLHHYWDQFADAAKRRFGVHLPYEEQHTWSVDRLKDQQLAAVIAETHADDSIRRAEPYPGAVEAVNRWAQAGCYIHITSHRAETCQQATREWLERIGLRHDDLHCSYDKVSRCLELGIDLLIDDSPVNITRAIEAGMRAATILHPWNAEVCEIEDVIFARDWEGLAERLDPIVLGTRRTA